MGRISRPELVAVPSGTFAMGSTADDIERCISYWGPRLVDREYTIPTFRTWLLKEFPRHEVELSPFQIGRYQITNLEYREFLRHRDGPAPESVRTGAPDDHPVWGVGFADAVAYTRWLRDETGEPFELPTEAQWEQAARGPDGREYPFGDAFDPTRCNTLESGIGGTVPVDAFPDGAAVCGALNLAGNVEEWTASRYAPYPGGTYVDDDLSRRLGADYPILRGGSFARGGDLARCARRHGPHPGPACRYTGFRVAISSSDTRGGGLT